MKEYQLRDMATGLYDSGKTECDWDSATRRHGPTRIKWSKSGKRWKQLNHLTSHLRHVTEPIRSTWEVVEYELVETGCFSAAVLARPHR